jgi:hypothetical protein
MNELYTEANKTSRNFYLKKFISYSLRFPVAYISDVGTRGGAVVEALRYKPEDRGIDSRWYHWKFSLT